MNLTKKVDLHFGESPIRGDTDEMQNCLDKNQEFCAVFSESDIPAVITNKDSDILVSRFGLNSDFARERDNCVLPFLVDISTGLASAGGLLTVPTTAQTLNGSGYRVGGMFFNMAIVEEVADGFETLGYAIDRKYE